MTAAYSAGWRANVELGDGQERMRAELARSIRHPSRSWHNAPTMRSYGRSSSTAHRLVHRLAALGVIAIQTTLGAHGGTRFTFGVRFWRRSPIRRAQLARMRTSSPGQTSLGLLEERARAPGLVRPAALGVSPSEPAGSFSELMSAAGFRPFWQ